MFLRFKNCIINSERIVSVLEKPVFSYNGHKLEDSRVIVLDTTAEFWVEETMDEIMGMLTRAK